MIERRFHQCHADGCDSEAVYGVRLSLRCSAPGVSDIVRMQSGIKVCQRHKDERKIREYHLTDHNRSIIRNTLTEQGGHPEPDFLSLAVTFHPIKAGDKPAEPKTAIHIQPGVVRCDRFECFEPARWQIKQCIPMMWQKPDERPLVEALTGMCVCDGHRATTTSADLMAGDGKSRTLGWLSRKGVSMPDLDRISIEFVPMPDGQRVDPVVFVGDGQTKDAVG